MDGLEAVGEVASSAGDREDIGMWVGLKIEGRAISVGRLRRAVMFRGEKN